MLNDDLMKALEETNLFKYLDINEMNLILEHSEIVSFSPEEMIMQQGKLIEGIYIIIRGEVKTTAKILGKGTIDLETLKHGDFLGVISLMERGPCATSAIAINHVDCLLITRESFEMLSLFSPEIKYKIFKFITEQVCRRLKYLYEKITTIMAKSDNYQVYFSNIIKSRCKPVCIDFNDTVFKKDHLQKTPLFKNFTQDEFNTFINHTILLKVPRHCVLIHQGMKKGSGFILLRGAVEASIIQHEKAAKLSVLGPISFFCSMNAVNHSWETLINYITCEKAVLLKISAADLVSIKQNYKIVWYKIYDLLCHAFVDLQKAADELNFRLYTEISNR